MSVRTLHHYEAVGLQRPSSHTEAGHRFYDAEAIARLQQIRSLRQLGLSLVEIRECLGRRDWSLRQVIGLHLARLREQMAAQRRLCERFEALAARLDGGGDVSPDMVLRTLEAMAMFEKYYTPDQLRYLRERADAVGPERIRKAEAEWPALVEECTGGDGGIATSLRVMYEQEPAIRQQAGIDRELMVYVERAVAAGRSQGDAGAGW